MSNWNIPRSTRLFEAILKLRTPSEARRFFRDLLTEEEILEFGRRWRAAQMLDQRIPYTRIVRETGLSSATVARVQRWLAGRQGGYRLLLRRFGRHTRPFSKSRLKEA